MSNNDTKDLSSSSRKEIDAFLDKVKATPLVQTGAGHGRLVFALDATASREATWDHACRIQGQMFMETTALGGLEVQLCYYRGFNEFSASTWMNQSEDLLQAMNRVHCAGGHTQIEKLLQHAIAETRRQKINAVVFVGDCLEENADRLCQLAGQLAIHAVPLFIFHEGGDPVAARAFREMARITQGAYCPFDAGSAQQLRDLLSAVAVYATGGCQALEDFQQRKGGALLQLMQQSKD
jgi:hypothetical protein